MTNRSMQEQLEAFLDWLQVQRYAPYTVTTSRTELHRFMAWCIEQGVTQWTDIDPHHIDAYHQLLSGLPGRKGPFLSAITRRNRLTRLRRFFVWLRKHQHIPVNSFDQVTFPRVRPSGLPLVLTVDEVQHLLRQPDVETTLGLRDRAILEVLYATGIRRNELCNLQLYDMGPSTVIIRQGKNRKDRIVPVGDSASHWLERYLQETRPRLAKRLDLDRVFLSFSGKCLLPGDLGALVRKYMNRAGISKPGRCHLLRHTMATHMLQGGADLRHVQAMLGHTTLETTSIYTRVDIGELQSIYRKTHPGSRR